MENYSKPPIRAQKTHEANERAMKHLRAMFGSWRLVDVTADDVEQYLRVRLKKRARVKTKGAFRELGILKATTVH
jgi:DNA-binding transcriptional regulator PaaX